MRAFDERMDLLFRDLFEEPRPVLITLVDSSGANRRVQGVFLLSEAGSESESFAWQADDLTMKLGFDESGQPVEPVDYKHGPLSGGPVTLSQYSDEFASICRSWDIEVIAKRLDVAPNAEDVARAWAQGLPLPAGLGPWRDAAYEGCLRGLRRR